MCVCFFLFSFVFFLRSRVCTGCVNPAGCVDNDGGCEVRDLEQEDVSDDSFWNLVILEFFL